MAGRKSPVSQGNDVKEVESFPFSPSGVSGEGGEEIIIPEGRTQTITQYSLATRVLPIMSTPAMQLLTYRDVVSDPESDHTWKSLLST